MNTLIAISAAFNLVCNGTNTTGEILGRQSEQTQVTRTLRVDLEAMRWCSGDCKSTSKIEEVRETQIIFILQDDGEGHDEILSVNRETGEFIDRKRFLTMKWIDMTRGTCERADFTGFPERKF